MFAMIEAQECVITEYMCASDWRRNSFDPSACPETPQHIFQLALKVDIQSVRQEEKKKRQCSLCLGHMVSGEHSNQLLPSQTSFPIAYVMRKLSDFTSSQCASTTDTSLQFLCLHSQIRATHWISFVCQVSLML